MQLSVFTNEELTKHYTTAIDGLCEVAGAYFYLGRLSDAQHLLRISLQLIDVGEVNPQNRLKLLLLYERVLIVDHLLTRGNADLMFSTVLQARQIAEAVQNQQGIADALSLLGQAHCFATTVASLKSGTSPFIPRGQGEYDETLAAALAYQEQALKLREALHDTCGVSESYFQIGLVHERWQQYEQAQEYYLKARQIAEQFGHFFEKTEPARHVAIHALRKGNPDQALTLALQALKLREEARFKPYLPLDHLLLRDIYLAKGDTENAELHTEIASAIALEMGLKTLMSSMPNIKGILAGQQEKA